MRQNWRYKQKNWQNDFDLWILHSKIRLYKNFPENLWEKSFDPFCRTFLTCPAKNKDEHEKTWENEFDFWILHIKIRLCGSFLGNLIKKILIHFLRHLKMKMKMKKYGEKISIFEFSISNLCYAAVFMEIQEIFFWPNFVIHFWRIEAKMEMNMKK